MFDYLLHCRNLNHTESCFFPEVVYHLAGIRQCSATPSMKYLQVEVHKNRTNLLCLLVCCSHLAIQYLRSRYLCKRKLYQNNLLICSLNQFLSILNRSSCRFYCHLKIGVQYPTTLLPHKIKYLHFQEYNHKAFQKPTYSHCTSCHLSNH